MKKINVIIADDQELAREGLVQMLRPHDHIRVEGLAVHGAQLLELVWELQPDVVLMDVKMPVMDGRAVARFLKEHHPRVGIVVLSNYDDDELVRDLMATGVPGYLLKNTSRAELVAAIESVHRGKPYYCAAIEEKMEALAAPPEAPADPLGDFSPRELQVMEGICSGHTNRTIGRQLGISTRTVEKLRARLYEKMGVNNTYGVMMYAREHKLFGN